MTARERERETNRTFLAEKATKGADGLYRWTSNGRIPFDDVLEDGGLSADERAAHATVRDREQAATVAQYRKAQRGRKVNAEERAEMRAAFGRGTTVVNILTGRRTRL